MERSKAIIGRKTKIIQVIGLIRTYPSSGLPCLCASNGEWKLFCTQHTPFSGLLSHVNSGTILLQNASQESLRSAVP